jgi:hypothetical protein
VKRKATKPPIDCIIVLTLKNGELVILKPQVKRNAEGFNLTAIWRRSITAAGNDHGATIKSIHVYVLRFLGYLKAEFNETAISKGGDWIDPGVDVSMAFTIPRIKELKFVAEM